MSRTIPQIRSRLYELSREHGLPELAQLAEETKRRRHGRQAPVRSRAATPTMADRIRAYAHENPAASQQAVAERFGVNIGRVSEALYGKRGVE